MPLSFLNLRGGRERHSVGLDIGYHCLKMVAVGGVPGKLDLLDCAIIPLERESDSPLPITSIKKAISSAVSRPGLDLSDLRISVSGKGVIVRHTEMPRMNQEELRSSIRYEAEMLLPFSLDDCIFDCHITDPQAKDRAKMKVALAAARKAVVQERLELFKDLSLVPRVVSIDSIALANAFEGYVTSTGLPPERRVPPDQTVSLVHIGAVRTILNIMSGTALELTRDIETGGNTATLAIARGLGVDFEEAERRKIAADTGVREFMSTMVTVMARELRSTFGYVSSKMGRNVARVYLSGGCALYEGLRETLASEFGIEVLAWNPLEGLGAGNPQAFELARGREGVLAIAAGLAVVE